MAGLKKRVDIFINGKQATQTIGELKGQSRKLNNEINKLTPGTQKYINKVKELKGVNSQLDAHRKKVRGIGGAFGGVKAQLGGFIKSFIGPGAIIAVVGLAAKGISQWVKKNLELEKGLSSLKSITGATTEDMKTYKKEAIEIGRTTTLSAVQAVEGFKLIGSAKPELLKNKDALIEVTKQAVTLAEAAELELGPASQSLAGTLNQFSLAADQSSRVINVLAAGSKEGAADILSLNDSLDKTGTVANSNNISLEENVGLLETLAEKNLKGAEAGTKLRNVLLTMSTIEALPPEALKQLEKYGVDTQLVSDKTVPFQERLKELSKIQNDSTALVKVFGKENLVTGQILLQNADKVKAYTDAVTGTNVANEQAAINTDNLDGDLKSLGSAWEGLLLTIGGSDGILRPIVQFFTSAINIVSDLFGAFKEGDTLKTETTFLKIGKAFTYLNPAMFLFGDGLRDAIDEQIRLNELASEVIDSVKDEGREVDILTSALGQNKEILKSGNLTAEETIKLNEQNEQIISELNDRYPELTSEIDLQSASLEDLSVLQQEITDNLIAQAIESAKAAEQEKILNTIIEKSIELNEQKATEANRSGVTNFFADIFADDAEDISATIDKEKQKLLELDDTFSEVEKTIDGLDLNYGEDFDTNTQIIIYAKEQLADLQNQLLNTDNEADKLAINAQIEAGTKLLKNSGAVRQDILDDILNKKIESEGSAEESITEKEISEAEKRRKSRQNSAKSRQKETEKLISELEKITKKAGELQDDFNNRERISLLKTKQEKELAELELKLDEKFNKEIEAATKLSQQKGEIGEKATIQLNTLELIKKEELEFEKSLINEKYRLIEEEKHKAELIKKNELELSLQESTLSLKVTKAAIAVEESADKDLSVRKELNDKLNEALIEQLDFEKETEIEKLRQKLEEGELTKEEFKNRELELEIEFQQSKAEIEKEAEEQRKQRISSTIESTANNISQVIDIIGQFREAQLNSEIKRINKESDIRSQKLEKEYKEGTISKQRYEKLKEQYEQDTIEQIAKAKAEAARKDKAANIIQAGINTAVAVTKALASLAPPASFISAGLVGLAGAAQIAVIASQPIPQFKDGGYNGTHKVKGAIDGKTYNANYLGKHSGGILPSSPSLILASEQGAEYYVPNPLLSDPRVAKHIEIIEAIRTNQMVDGGFSGSVQESSQNLEQQLNVTPINNSNNQEELIKTLTKLNSSIDNIKVVIGDLQIDEITNKQNELSDLRGE